MKVGDKVKFTYPRFKVGIIETKKRFHKRYIYIIKTLDNKHIGAIYPHLQLLTDEQYILEAL